MDQVGPFHPPHPTPRIFHHHNAERPAFAHETTTTTAGSIPGPHVSDAGAERPTKRARLEGTEEGTPGEGEKVVSTTNTTVRNFHLTERLGLILIIYDFQQATDADVANLGTRITVSRPSFSSRQPNPPRPRIPNRCPASTKILSSAQALNTCPNTAPLFAHAQKELIEVSKKIFDLESALARLREQHTRDGVRLGQATARLVLTGTSGFTRAVPEYLSEARSRDLQARSSKSRRSSCPQRKGYSASDCPRTNRPLLSPELSAGDKSPSSEYLRFVCARLSHQMLR